MGQVIKIGGRLYSVEQGNVVAGANAILDDTKGKKQSVINQETDAELVRLAGVDLTLSQFIDAILLLIPSAATALNQLADKAFVNSSIATNTATFRGTYNSVSDLGLAVDATHAQIGTALLSVIAMCDNNDFAFVQVPTSGTEPTEIAKTERYKFNGTAWEYEYDLNNSGFTAAQWAAINSSITVALVNKLRDLPDNTTLQAALTAITSVIPSAASSSNQLADKAYVTAIQQAITALFPAEASVENQLADKAYVGTQIILDILAAIPAFKGQFTTFADLQAVQSPKSGDCGIVRTKDSDGHDVFTFYQYKDEEWREYYVLSYHPIDKPATTGFMGEYPYNGMGRVELPMNMVDGWPDNTWIYYPVNGVVCLLYSWHLQLYAVYNSDTQEGLGLDDNLVVQPADYNIADISEIVGNRYLSFIEEGGVWIITKPNETTITSTELNNTNIYNYNDPQHKGINILTQSMISAANTIYVIQYDYVLAENITIPANCVLEFDGGSLNGYSLVVSNCEINNGIFNDTNIVINGSFYVHNSIFNNPNKIVSIEAGKQTENIKIDTCKFIHCAKEVTSQNTLACIYARYYSNIEIVNCYFEDFAHSNTTSASIVCTFTESNEYSTLHDSAIIENNTFINNIFGGNSALHVGENHIILALGNDNVSIKNNHIIDCTITGCDGELIYTKSKNGNIDDNYIKGNSGGEGIICCKKLNEEISTYINIKNNTIYSEHNYAIIRHYGSSIIEGNNIESKGGYLIDATSDLIGKTVVKNNIINLAFNPSEVSTVFGTTRTPIYCNNSQSDLSFENNYINASGLDRVFIQLRNQDKNISFYNNEFVINEALIDVVVDSQELVERNNTIIFDNNRVNCNELFLINTSTSTITDNLRIEVTNNKIVSAPGSNSYSILDNRAYSGNIISINNNDLIINSGIGFIYSRINNVSVVRNNITDNTSATQIVSRFVSNNNVRFIDNTFNKKPYFYSNASDPIVYLAIINNNIYTTLSNKTLLGTKVTSLLICNNIFSGDNSSYDEIQLKGNDAVSNYIIKNNFLNQFNNIATFDGLPAGIPRYGTFALKPSSSDIYVGFRYFCTDKQTTEGATNGIEIIYKGNNVWVDALGRVVS